MSTVLDRSTFTFPELTEHTPIMVAARPNEPGIPAFVTKVKQSTVSCAAIFTGPGGGLLRFETCYHKDDPRVIERPGLFESPTNGVFWLSDLEVERRAVVSEMRAVKQEVRAQLDAMNALLEELVTRLSKIENRGKSKE